MKPFIPFILILSLLMACAPSAPADDLNGKWTLAAYGDPASPTPALPNVKAHLIFKDGQLSGNVGCNSFGGEYRISGDTITFEPVFSTEMACPDTDAQEQGVLSVLQGTVTYKHNDTSLILTSADGMMVRLALSDIEF